VNEERRTERMALTLSYKSKKKGVLHILNFVYLHQNDTSPTWTNISIRCRNITSTARLRQVRNQILLLWYKTHEQTG